MKLSKENKAVRDRVLKNPEFLSSVIQEAENFFVGCLDMDLAVLWCNKACAKVSGIPRGELIGSDFLRTLSASSRDLVRDIIVPEAIKKGSSRVFKIHTMYSGPKSFTFQTRFFFFHEIGKPDFFLVFHFNRTEGTRGSEALEYFVKQKESDILNAKVELMDRFLLICKSTCGLYSSRTCKAVNALRNELFQDKPKIASSLTPAEQRVAGLVQNGKSIKQVASELSISERTVQNHRHSIRLKCGIKNPKTSLYKYLQGFTI